MNFAYVDESGDEIQSDIFVMLGLLVDAYRLRRITADFDQLLRDFLAQHPNHPAELKTKKFINGKDGWNAVAPEDRKAFLRSVCELAARDGKLFVSAISFQRFGEHLPEGPHPTRRSYWHAAGMYVTSLIQKKHQEDQANKGLTVLVMDDNKMGMSNLSDAIYAPDSWFDCLYQRRKLKKGKVTWASDSKSSTALNVDLVQLIAREILPEINYEEERDGMNEALRELSELGIRTASDLRELLTDKLDAVMTADRVAAAKWETTSAKRKANNAFFNHVGLIRQAMIERFGEERVREVMRQLKTGGDP